VGPGELTNPRQNVKYLFEDEYYAVLLTGSHDDMEPLMPGEASFLT
jgi:hypothetical protein